MSRHALKWKQNKCDIKGNPYTQLKLEIHTSVGPDSDVRCDSKEVFQAENASNASCSQKNPSFLLCFISIRIGMFNAASKQSLMAFLALKSSEVLYTPQLVVTSITAFKESVAAPLCSVIYLTRHPFAVFGLCDDFLCARVSWRQSSRRETNFLWQLTLVDLFSLASSTSS